MKLNVALLLLLFVIAGFQTATAQLGVQVIQKNENANRALYRLKHKGRFFECRLNLNNNRVAVQVRLGNGSNLFSGRMNSQGYQMNNGCSMLAEEILLWLAAHVNTEDPNNTELVKHADIPTEYDTKCLKDCADKAMAEIDRARANEAQRNGNANSLGQHCTPIFIDDIERIVSGYIGCIEKCRN